ncbi:uncharacterized protein LOC107882918 [Acyrthosiphon pisum]|uniref:Uncharacterized protein n=1 Tax=Acyrthosiphon pisum TaxID=7029 RepID=A0A8R2H695_ACYPI|nr:uncharacterized protein LOC107882918 [Acyrthosiphon pisum]|eukprot:XP_016657552.1 PREDICTED: uncharacterized protein LOC107882918 [Acyrthosiphon pisum]
MSESSGSFFNSPTRPTTFDSPPLSPPLFDDVYLLNTDGNGGVDGHVSLIFDPNQSYPCPPSNASDMIFAFETEILQLKDAQSWYLLNEDEVHWRKKMLQRFQWETLTKKNPAGKILETLKNISCWENTYKYIK